MDRVVVISLPSPGAPLVLLIVPAPLVLPRLVLLELVHLAPHLGVLAQLRAIIHSRTSSFRARRVREALDL